MCPIEPVRSRLTANAQLTDYHASITQIEDDDEYENDSQPLTVNREP
jgi:hypothetical protein